MYEDRVDGGSHWSLLMRRGTILRFSDIEGEAMLAYVAHNPQDKLERYNAPDTLKCQHSFKLTRGHCLYSDMGRIFCSIIEDSLGWHEHRGGNCERSLREKYTVKTLGKPGMTGRAAVSTVLPSSWQNMGWEKGISRQISIFSARWRQTDGNMRYVPGHSSAGSTIDLRFEMDTLVVLHTCPTL